MTYTLASEQRPVRRKVVGPGGKPFVLEVYRDFLTLRPIRVRNPDAIVTIKFAALYTGALLSRPTKRRRVRRGVL